MVVVFDSTVMLSPSLMSLMDIISAIWGGEHGRLSLPDESVRNNKEG